MIIMAEANDCSLGMTMKQEADLDIRQTRFHYKLEEIGRKRKEMALAMIEKYETLTREGKNPDPFECKRSLYALIGRELKG